MTTRPISQAIGFEELRWLSDLQYRKRKGQMPDLVGAGLVRRGLIERNAGGYQLTARGRIALAKLG